MSKTVIKSYARSLVAAFGALAAAGVDNWEAYVWGAVVAVLPPAIRAVDKNDPAFGCIADVVEVIAVEKVAVASKKKAAPAKKAAPVNKPAAKKTAAKKSK